MHLNRVDLNLFVVFDTIFTEGSLTQAALKLSLSQPAVSHALARLRELLGDSLFARQGKRMVPTPFARNLIGTVRQSLQLLESGLQGPAEFDPGQAQRVFHLGMRDVLEAIALPPLVARLQRAAPGVALHCVRIDRRDMETELASGGLDLAVDVALPMGSDVRHRPLMNDQLVVVARGGHPAFSASLEQGLTMSTYLAQSHVLVSSRRTGPGLEDFELNRMGLRRRIGLRCQHYFAACRVVSETDMILTMPEHYARIANEPFGNQLHAFPLSTPSLDVHLYWHASGEHDPANAWLRGQLDEVFAELLGEVGSSGSTKN
ncbi:LysR family transcriptional regulator [Aquabacterium sp.]|uniref:LysR family transcriptional regulator n=1 Tax=Aquabacterium sp. TaxID=1872578 RepID=UPI0035B35AA4